MCSAGLRAGRGSGALGNGEMMGPARCGAQRAGHRRAPRGPWANQIRVWCNHCLPTERTVSAPPHRAPACLQGSDNTEERHNRALRRRARRLVGPATVQSWRPRKDAFRCGRDGRARAPGGPRRCVRFVVAHRARHPRAAPGHNQQHVSRNLTMRRGPPPGAVRARTESCCSSRPRTCAPGPSPPHRTRQQCQSHAQRIRAAFLRAVLSARPGAAQRAACRAATLPLGGGRPMRARRARHRGTVQGAAARAAAALGGG